MAGPNHRADGAEPPVYLRPLRESDVQVTYEWWRDPLVQGLTGEPLGPQDLDEFRRFFVQNYVETGSHRVTAGIVLCDTDRLIGIVVAEMDPAGHEAEYGIKIGDRDCWGKGYGTAATRLFIDQMFRTTDIDLFFGLAELTNERAKHAMISAGLRICCLMYDREFLRVELTRAEWKASAQRRADVREFEKPDLERRG